MSDSLCVLIQADEGNIDEIIYGHGYPGLRCAVREHYNKQIAETKALTLDADFKASNLAFYAEHSDALVTMLDAHMQWEPGLHKLKNVEPQWREWTLLIVADAAPVPQQWRACPNCGQRKVFLPKTPRDVVERLGVQQGSRVAASLRGDKTTQEAAEKWLKIIAADHWHEIISDLEAGYAAPVPAREWTELQAEGRRLRERAIAPSGNLGEQYAAQREYGEWIDKNLDALLGVPSPPAAG